MHVIDTSVRSQLQFAPDGGASRAEPADLSESDLLARMSHEMRTPLSAILGFAQLMESCTPPPTGAQKRRIDLILQAGWHLETLINMTRDLALLQSGALSLSLNPVALAAVLPDVAAMIEPQAHMRGICVTFPRLDAPCWVLADGTRLKQVLGHLLAAAIEYSEADSTLVVDCDIRSAQYIRIGIHEADAALSAGRETQTLQPPQAAGIGMLFAKRLIEPMGGVLGAECALGTGKVFSFDLKRTPVSAAIPATRNVQHEAKHPSMTSRGKTYDV